MSNNMQNEPLFEMTSMKEVILVSSTGIRVQLTELETQTVILGLLNAADMEELYKKKGVL